ATMWTLGDPSPTGTCVPSNAIIDSVVVNVTHGVLDHAVSTYTARIRILSGVNWVPFDLHTLATDVGIVHEVSETIVDDGSATPTTVLSLLNTPALLNGANLEFQAKRDGGAMRVILNEISLTVTYHCEECGEGIGDENELITGGGYVTYGTRQKTNANFGFNAHMLAGIGSGQFQYADGTNTIHGTVTSIQACTFSAGIPGGTGKFTGSYSATTTKGKKTLYGSFTVYVEDNGEPGKGFDRLGLVTTGDLPLNVGGLDAGSSLVLTGGNIQVHFCN
ncbi:MAG TPA: post-COAP-1 domain-containing protein, partial [Vicinamibacterales bacterium]|nr:post-COAP-1 domain-containing protein [Vicinamibacterales bacterium]